MEHYSVSTLHELRSDMSNRYRRKEKGFEPSLLDEDYDQIPLCNAELEYFWMFPVIKPIPNHRVSTALNLIEKSPILYIDANVTSYSNELQPDRSIPPSPWRRSMSTEGGFHLTRSFTLNSLDASLPKSFLTFQFPFQAWVAKPQPTIVEQYVEACKLVPLPLRSAAQCGGASA